MYSSIINNPATSLAATAKVYLHFLSLVLRGSCPISCLVTWVQTPPGDLPMQGVTTQVYASKSSTAWITALKKNPDNQGADPSLLRMRDILLQTFFTHSKLLTTDVQLLPVAEITSPRYLK